MQSDHRSHPAQTWVIEQYLQGRLPDDLHQQVEQRRQTDPAFEQRVLAHWLVITHLEHEQNTAEFYRDLDTLTRDVVSQRGAYHTGRSITFLPQLLVGAAVLLLVGGWLIFQDQRPLNKQTEWIDVTPLDPEGAGFGGTATPIVRFNRRPGWPGLFQPSNHYAWPNDTLYVYNEGIRKFSADSLELIYLGPTNQYLLRAGQRSLRVNKGQTETTSLD